MNAKLKMTTSAFLLFSVVALLFIGQKVTAQIPGYSCEIRNESFISSNIFEFDIYLIRTGTTPLELACFNTGIKLNPAFVNGGTITPSFVSGSELLPAQVPNMVAYDAESYCIKIAPQVPPRNYTNGVTSGTIISNTTGTRVCRLRLTNTASFGNDPVNYTWSINLMPYHTVVSAFVAGSTPKVNFEITSAQSHSQSHNVIVYLQGLYDSGMGNRKSQDENGDHFAGPVADQITVLLAQNVAPFSIEHSFTGNLYQNGKCSFQVPGNITGSHYIVIKHRNSIETWSATPVDFTAVGANYNFTTGTAQAYGENLLSIEGVSVIFAGDVNQDGGVGTIDMGMVDNLSSQFESGYLPEDVNGDGSVGTVDMGIIDNNAANFITVITPFGKAPTAGK